MKEMIALTMLMSMMPFAYSQEAKEATSTTEAQASEVKSTKRKWNVSLSLGNQSAEFTKADNSKSIDGRNITIKGGKDLSLGEVVDVQFNLGLSMSTYDKDMLGYNSGEMRTTDIGPSFKIFMKNETSYGTFRPFIDLGYSIGSFNNETKLSDGADTAEFDLQTTYTRFHGALGAEFVFNNGITPFSTKSQVYPLMRMLISTIK